MRPVLRFYVFLVVLIFTTRSCAQEGHRFLRSESVPSPQTDRDVVKPRGLHRFLRGNAAAGVREPHEATMTVHELIGGADDYDDASSGDGNEGNPNSWSFPYQVSLNVSSTTGIMRLSLTPPPSPPPFRLPHAVRPCSALKHPLAVRLRVSRLCAPRVAR